MMPVSAAKLVERLADDAGDDLVRDELAGLHHGLGLEADRRAGLDGGTQHVAGRKLDHAALGDQALRLGALARSRRSQQNDVHHRSLQARAALYGATPVIVPLLP